MAAVGPQSMAILENQEMMMRWSQQVTLYSLGTTGLKRRSAAQVSRYIFSNYCKCYFPMAPHVRLLVGLSVIISWKLHFHAHICHIITQG